MGILGDVAKCRLLVHEIANEKDNDARIDKLKKLHSEIAGIETRLGYVKDAVYKIDVKKKIFEMI